ncbi:hypothetical protein [Candidatus Methylomirabilis sp.]
MGPRTRLTLYKAKEDELIREWLDQTAYGETVPFLKGEGDGGA